MKKDWLKKIERIGKVLLVILLFFAVFLPVHGDENGLDVTSYITDAIAQYREGGSGQWRSVSDETVIPADATVRFTVSFGNVDVQTLKDNGNTLVYPLTNAAFLKGISGEDSTISDGTNVVGYITRDSAAKIIRITFTNDYLNNLTTLNSGSFNFTASADAAVINENPTQTFTIGSKTLNLTFEPNAIAKTGSLTVSKSTPTYEADGETGYLKYTLTVSTGDQPMPDVHIDDAFTQNAQYVDRYENMTTGGGVARLC